jgi:hypothetical protein
VCRRSQPWQAAVDQAARGAASVSVRRRRFRGAAIRDVTGEELAVSAPMSTHAVMWIDHEEARIFHVHPETVDRTVIEAPQHRIHRHPKGRGEAREHPADQRRFFEAIERSLNGIENVLFVGPASAKQEFVNDVHTHSRALESKIVGVETVDHPTDGEIVAHARAYFRRSDRMNLHGR